MSLTGCASLLGGGDKPIPTFDLSAPTGFTAPRAGTGLLVVTMPTALAVLDTEKILVQPAPGQISYLAGAQWSDRLPALFQARLLETFENASRARSVARPGERIVADYLLLTDIRIFGLEAGASPQAVVDVSAKVVNDRTGRILAAQVFTARVAAAGTKGPEVALALDQAADRVFNELVKWAARF